MVKMDYLREKSAKKKEEDENEKLNPQGGQTGLIGRLRKLFGRG